jgi:hypothetical protein
VRGTSVSNIGVYGQSAAGGSNTAAAVYGADSNANGAGVGGANTINGNLGFLGGPSYGVAGVNAHGAQAAVYGTSSSSSGYGVQGNNSSSGSNGYLGGVDYGVFGSSSGNNGVVGKTSANNTGAIWGHNNTSGNDGFLGGPDYGIYGVSAAKTGVYGSSSALDAVAGHCQTNSCFAIHGVSAGGGYAGVFEGTVSINGDLNVNGDVSKGSGSFKIDDPIDPANKYLYHSFVESPDMKDVYDGEATLDASGIAVVELPAWFQALNRDFRYQLTALDTAQPALHIAKRIESNRFTIAGGVPGGEVSWQVTGIRQDAFANAHRIPTEIAKPANEQGRYLHPELFGQPAEKSIGPIADRGIAPDERR